MRIGSVGYLNARPLTDALDASKYPLTLDHPAVIAKGLADGALDLALVPVAAALSLGDRVRVLPGWCIGADGEVTSVLFAAETPPEQWTVVHLDGVSRTSVTLARLLLAGPLRERLRPDLQIVDAPPTTGVERARGTEAAVVIGDVARELPERLSVRLDLAALWREWTGLPFVFAVWAGRPDLPDAVRAEVRAAGARGVAEIRIRYQGDDLVYLTRALRYPLDERALMGLRRFAALAHAAGLIADEEIRLYPPSRRLADDPAAEIDAWLDAAASGATIDDEAARRLDAEARTPDLLAAADLRRRAFFPGVDVPFEPEGDVPAADPGRATALARCVRLRIVGADGADAAVAAVAAVRALRPDARIVAARAVDVLAWGDDVLERLADAGADEIDLGDGVLDPAWRADPVPLDAWARIARRAAGRGLVRRVALRLGGGEDSAARVASLAALRSLHAETGAVRVFTAATRPDENAARPGNTGADQLRMLALARLWFGPETVVVASPATEGGELAQAALHGGASGFGAVPLAGDKGDDERLAEAERDVRTAGFAPVARAA